MITELMRLLHEGSWFRLPYDGSLYQLQIVDAPGVVLQSGVLAFQDVNYLRSGPLDECRIDLVEGEWSMRIARLESEWSPSYAVACIVGRFEDAETWEPVSGEPPSFQTDQAIIGVYDAPLRERLKRRFLGEDASFYAMIGQASETGSSRVDEAGHALMSVFTCGPGAGRYDVWRGIGGTGEPVCAVVDMEALPDYEPVRKSGP